MAGSLEFSLLVECCRGSFAHASGPSIAVDGVDWKRFLALARFHRVEGLAWNALSSTSRVDAGCRDELAAAAAGIAAHNLWATAASRKLHAEFEAAAITVFGTLFTGKNVANCAGMYRSVTAKMIGITPAVFTLSGR